MPRFAPDLRRWIRHFRDLSGFNRLWVLGSADPSSPRLVSPWISDTVQLVTQVSPNLRSLTVPNPAAGADWSQVVPHDVNWKLVAVTYIFTASAIVANRAPRLELADTLGIMLWRGESANVQVASTAITYVGSAKGDPQLLDPNRAILTPVDFWLPRNFILRTATGSIDAGDQFSAIRLFVEEWPG